MLAKRKNTSQWRFPGGFSDIVSSSFEDDACRDLLEETQLVGTEIEYIGSTCIDDPRYRPQRDKIKTIFFAITSWEGTPIPSDDLKDGEICLASLNTFNLNHLVPYHVVLWDMLNKWVSKKTA
jgi:ADP-ribose pyrophosphatase YjhB (NUDIX family)